MYLRHLSLGDFRSYRTAEVALSPGVSTLVGLNGVGKTNLVEAVGYLASLGSHRVAQDAPLVRFGAERAIVRGAVVRDERETLVEIEIVPGRANRARLNRGSFTRPREVLGTLRTVLFAPEDLSLVKGDPAERRRFLDDLLVSRQPRWAGVRSDYDKILKQRNALLKSASPARSRRSAPRRIDPDTAPETLAVWDDHLATVGSQLLYARLRLLRDLRPLLTRNYTDVSATRSQAHASYRSSLDEAAAARLAAGEVPGIGELRELILVAMHTRRVAELERGISLVGPHRDDLTLLLGELPAKGYASHGESWSFALALKLGAYHLLRHDLGEDPVLVLDDVFAELDVGRRERLAGLLVDGEQVLITAAVPADVPSSLQGPRFHVRPGVVGDADGSLEDLDDMDDTGEDPGGGDVADLDDEDGVDDLDGERDTEDAAAVDAVDADRSALGAAEHVDLDRAAADSLGTDEAHELPTSDLPDVAHESVRASGGG